MRIRFACTVLALSLMTSVSAEETATETKNMRYVSDELEIVMRRGESTKYKIRFSVSTKRAATRRSRPRKEKSDMFSPGN